MLLPGGTFSSLAFFNQELEKRELSRTQQYTGSYIFGFASTVSIIVIAIPALLLLFLRGELNIYEIAGFVLLCLVIAIMIYGFILIRKGKGIIYRLLEKYRPEWLLGLESFNAQQVSRKGIIQSVLVSVLIELTGVAHLYISLLALDATAYFSVALIGYVTMIIVMSFSPFLKGLGAIEFSMTYILVKFGYDTTLAASVVLLFRAFEFWIPLVFGLLAFIARRQSLLLRLIPSFLLLASGIINILSVLTPALPPRLAMVNDLLPAGMINVSNFGVLVFGIIISLMSVYLFMGSRNAWKIALVLTFISAFGHLFKGLDYEEAIVSMVAFLSLVYTRKFYFIRHDISLQMKGVRQFLLVMVVVVVLGIAGFYLVDMIHFRKDLSLGESVRSFLYAIIGRDLYVPQTKFAHEFLFTTRFVMAAMLVYLVWMFLTPAKKRAGEQSDDMDRARELVKDFGHSRMDYFKTYFDKYLFFNKEKSGFLSYKLADNYAVVLEDPVCLEDRGKPTLIREFSDYCRESGLGLFFYRVPGSSLGMYREEGFQTLLIGQEAVVHPADFSLAGGSKQSLRNSLNKISKAGYEAKINEPPLKDGLLQKLQSVSDNWLKEHKSKEIGFTQGVFDRAELKNQVVITVENPEEEVIAFANLIDTHTNKEGTYDLIRKTHNAPNGVDEFMLIRIFEYFRDKGYDSVHLGMAPLSGFKKGNSVQERAVYFTVEYIRRNTRFGGLWHFKEKFDPEWEDTFMAYESVYDLLRFPVVLNKVSKI